MRGAESHCSFSCLWPRAAARTANAFLQVGCFACFLSHFSEAPPIREKSILLLQICWEIHIKLQGSSSPRSCDQAVHDEWNWSLHAVAVQGLLHLSGPNYAFSGAPCYYERKFAHR